MSSWIDSRNSSLRDASKSHDLLAEEQLIHLRSYRYQSVDKSWISNNILRHYWNFMVELLPMWLAPNAVTLLGFLCILINVIFLVIYMPDLVGPGPSWLYFSFAAGMWAYSTMDNIDGKQARRTGSSSPLGELFDHGIDSLNCTLASLCQAAALGLGATPIGAFTALLPTLPMFFSTWETYHTHVLYLGPINGPTEGLILGCILMTLSGIFGPEIYSTPLVSHFPSLSVFFSPTTCFNDLWVLIMGGGFVFLHLPFCIWNVIQVKRSRGLPVTEIGKEFLGIATFTAGCITWVGSKNSGILVENHLVLFCVTMSFVFGRMTTKIILAHLVKQDFPVWTMMLVPLVGGAALINADVFGLPVISTDIELLYLRGYLIFAFALYARWAIMTINAICGFLGIRCLRITPKVDLSAGTTGGPLLNGTAKRQH